MNTIICRKCSGPHLTIKCGKNEQVVQVLKEQIPKEYIPKEYIPK